MAERIFKYPRTPHLTGSRLQPGDDDLRLIGWEELTGSALVVEEKIDGANAAVSFDDDGSLLLQSRGHYLDGGPRERHFALFKSWATCHQSDFWQVLGTRYVMYGEWMYARHTIFYDALPHYFLEFDVMDKGTGIFLSTPARRTLLSGLPIESVPLVWQGHFRSAEHFQQLIKRSAFQSDGWREKLRQACEERGLDVARALNESDAADLMEGLYLKLEDDGQVCQRFKFVRPTYTQTVADSGSHWLERPLIPNQLRKGIDIFAR